MSKPPRRSRSSSPTPRPRKIAGRDGHVRPDELRGAESAVQESDVQEPAPEDSTDGTSPEPSSAPDGVLASTTLTMTLLGWLGVVLVALIVILGLLVVPQLWPSDDAAPEPPEGQIAVPEGRPVVASEPAWQEGVAAAAEAAQEIVSVDWEQYDAGIDSAVKLMTEDFASGFKETKADVREQIIERQTVVRANITAQSVVRANETELQALIFLNQFVTRQDEEEGTVNVVTPYKVLVTMVHTDNGWLVDGLETDSPPVATGD